MGGTEGRGRVGLRALGFERWALTGERVAEERQQHRAQGGPRRRAQQREGLRWTRHASEGGALGDGG